MKGALAWAATVLWRVTSEHGFKCL